jgi:hypothetical protein
MKKLVYPLLVIGLSSPTLANDPSLKLRGGVDFQAGYHKHTARSSGYSQRISRNQDHFGFFNSVYFYGDAKNVLDSGITYGAQMGVKTSARNTRKASSFLYFISDSGKFELGSNKSANAAMRITGHSNACATGGLWDIWAKTDPLKRGRVYVTNYGNFLDQKVRDLYQEEYSRKITYYTPKFKDFQLGISYVPDTSNVGYANFSEEVLHNPSKTSRYNANIKDGIAFGITHDKELSSTTKIRTAFVGERGKVVQNFDRNPLMHKLKNLKSYLIGSELIYNHLSVAGCYGNYMKSLTSKEVNNNRNTDLWSVGLRYNFENNISSSITYFNSNHQKNQIQTITLASEYKVTRGVLPYTEVSYYKTSGAILGGNNQRAADRHTGFIGLVGMKVEF